MDATCKFVLSLAASLGVLIALGGCPEKTVTRTPATLPTVIATPQTTFTPPTTVPSLSPTIQSASTQSALVERTAATASQQAAALTPENLATARPPLLLTLTDLQAGIRWLGTLLGTAQAEAKANDAAVARLTAEVEGARRIVAIREEQLKVNAEQAVKDLQARDQHWKNQRESDQQQWAKERDALTADRDAWRAKTQDAHTALLRWIWGGTVGLGVLGLIGGALLFMVKPAPALVVSGLGALCIALGSAGMYFGREIAIAGLVLGAVALLGGLWAAIHFLRQRINAHAAAGIEIAEGVAQAARAGAVNLDAAKPYFDNAQGTIARQLVDVATKPRTDPKLINNPYATLLDE